MTPIEKYKDIDMSKLPEKAVEKVKEIAGYLNDTKLRNSNDADSKDAYKKAEESMNTLYSKIAEKYPESIKSKVKKEPEPKTPQAMAKKIAQASIVQPKKGKSTASAKPTDRGNITKLAKEIRKDGETWHAAIKRAGEMIKSQKTKAVKNANKQYKKLQEFLAKNPIINSATVVSGSKGNWQTRPLDKERDASRKAKTPGKRISKEGNTYYEYRENRVDRFGRSKYPYLKLGGMLHGAGMFEHGGEYADGGAIKKDKSKKWEVHFNAYDLDGNKTASHQKFYVTAFDENSAKNIALQTLQEGSNDEDFEIVMVKKYADGGYVSHGEDYEYVNTFGIDQKDFEKLVDAYHKSPSYNQAERVESRLTFTKMREKYGEEKIDEIGEYIHETHQAHEHKYAKGGEVGNDYLKLIQEYQIKEGFEDEPMDGDDTQRMANEYAKKYSWSKEEKRNFLKFANEHQGNYAKGGAIRTNDEVSMYFNKNTELEIYGENDYELEEPSSKVFKANQVFDVTIYDVDKDKYSVQFMNGNVAFIPKKQVTIKSINGVDIHAKGGKVKGKLTSKYNYVPNYMIQEIEVERKGKTTFIDAANVLDGVYVKKGVKYKKGGNV